MPSENAGRHANSAGGSALSKYWDNVKHSARNALTDEAPENEELLEMPEEQAYMESLGEMAQLTYQQRIMGFFTCLGMGIVFILIAIALAPAVALVPLKFAFFLTIGNIFCLGSTMFLVGFTYQVKNMFSQSRFEAACLYAFSMVLTLLCAVWLRSSIGCIIAAALQIGAILWYALSFLPYARQTITLVFTYASAIIGPIISAAGQGVSSCFGLIFR